MTFKKCIAKELNVANKKYVIFPIYFQIRFLFVTLSKYLHDWGF